MRTTPSPAEHLRLDINSDDSAAWSDQVGERKSEIPESAPKIRDNVSLGHETVKNDLRVVDKAPERIVKGVTEPPGTSMLVPGDESVNEAHSKKLNLQLRPVAT